MIVDRLFQSSRRVFSILVCGLICVLLGSCAVKSAGTNASSKSIRVLMVGGGSSHNFDTWYKDADAKTLSTDGLATVTYTSNTDSIGEYLKQSDVLFLSNNQPIKDPNVRKAIFDFAAQGKGIVLSHAALWYNWKDWPEYNLQLAGGGSRGHDRYGSFQFNVVNTNHPITKGVESGFTLKDERYYYIPDPAGPGIEVLATNTVAGSDKIYPTVFVVKNPNARIAAISLGHDAESHNIANYQTLLRNTVKWVARK
ncbi:ThuA domain-containing protein [Daejeonella sp.]|uniref:ThuA domain-containing protein n=1 Tax=Daejeonella sp. TaxID=2805397 RepID=UPI00398322B9